MDVYLGSRALLVADGAGTPLHAQGIEGADGVDGFDGFEEAVTALETWLGDRADRPRLRLWLGGALARPFLFKPAAAVRSTDEALRIARALAPERTGLAAPCEVWLDGGADAGIAVALPTVVRERLLRLAAGGRPARVAAIRPWWSEPLRAGLARDAATTVVAVQDCEALTVLAGAGGAFTVATTLAPLPAREAAGAALTRLLLAHDVPAGPELVVRLQMQMPRVERGEAALACALGSLVELGR